MKPPQQDWLGIEIRRHRPKICVIISKINKHVSKLLPNGVQIVSKWFPNGIKTASKLVLEAFQGPNLILGSILGGIFPQFGLPRDLKKHLKSVIF